MGRVRQALGRAPSAGGAPGPPGPMPRESERLRNGLSGVASCTAKHRLAPLPASTTRPSEQAFLETCVEEPERASCHGIRAGVKARTPVMGAPSDQRGHCGRAVEPPHRCDRGKGDSGARFCLHDGPKVGSETLLPTLRMAEPNHVGDEEMATASRSQPQISRCALPGFLSSRLGDGT